ncbi:hypothetical protein MLDJOKPK_00170 [Salmonella phage SPAsTU]|nr:hypothetical protein MLDJOKPK_00170 [Salmonella phage SPAsTU]
MEHFKASAADIVDGKVESPLPLDVIPNQMGINLCSVDSLEWTRQEDGQLVDLKIKFIPTDNPEE